MECLLRCKGAKESPTSLSSWRKWLMPQHLAHVRSVSILLLATDCGKNAHYVEPQLQSIMCAWRLWEITEIASGRKMRQCLLIYAAFRGVISMTHLSNTVQQAFEARLPQSTAALHAHTVQLDAVVFQVQLGASPKFPFLHPLLWPPQSAKFCIKCSFPPDSAAEITYSLLSFGSDCRLHCFWLSI